MAPRVHHVQTATARDRSTVSLNDRVRVVVNCEEVEGRVVHVTEVAVQVEVAGPGILPARRLIVEPSDVLGLVSAPKLQPSSTRSRGRLSMAGWSAGPTRKPRPARRSGCSSVLSRTRTRGGSNSEGLEARRPSHP
jgi:hypothetical protein